MRILRHSAFALALVAGSTAFSGCTVKMPLPSLVADDDVGTTASITLASTRPAEFHRDDRGLAGSAMDRALDPLRAGTPASWADAASGAHGAITAAGKAFVRDDRLCRGFTAIIIHDKPGLGRPAKSNVAGVACRVGAASWTIEKVSSASDPG